MKQDDKLILSCPPCYLLKEGGGMNYDSTKNITVPSRPSPVSERPGEADAGRATDIFPKH